MEDLEYIRLGETLFYAIAKTQPLKISERIVAIKLYDELSPLDHPILVISVYGESGKDMWCHMSSSDYAKYELEEMQAIGKYLSNLFSCPLEINLRF